MLNRTNTTLLPTHQIVYNHLTQYCSKVDDSLADAYSSPVELLAVTMLAVVGIYFYEWIKSLIESAVTAVDAGAWVGWILARSDWICPNLRGSGRIQPDLENSLGEHP